MKRSLSALMLAAAVATALLAVTPAAAHTNFVIAGYQILNGGEVNGYGATANVQVNDGPASDGTLIFTNLDPVAHRIVGTCTAVCTDGWRIRLEPGERIEFSVGLGSYVFSDPGYPTMRGRVRVTSQEG